MSTKVAVYSARLAVSAKVLQTGERNPQICSADRRHCRLGCNFDLPGASRRDRGGGSSSDRRLRHRRRGRIGLALGSAGFACRSCEDGSPSVFAVSRGRPLCAFLLRDRFARVALDFGSTRRRICVDCALHARNVGVLRRSPAGARTGAPRPTDRHLRDRLSCDDLSLAAHLGESGGEACPK